MGLRGPKPKGAEHHILRGTYRPSRHGPRPDPSQDFGNRAAQLAAECALSPEKQAAREKEIADQMRRMKGK